MRISDWSSDVCSSDLSSSNALSHSNSECLSLIYWRRLPSLYSAHAAAVHGRASTVDHVPSAHRRQPARCTRPSRTLLSPLQCAILHPPHALNSLLIRCSLPSRSEEHTSELQSLMRISYAVF